MGYWKRITAALLMVLALVAGTQQPAQAASQSLVASDWSAFKDAAYTNWMYTGWYMTLLDSNGDVWVYNIVLSRTVGDSTLHIKSVLKKQVSTDVCALHPAPTTGMNDVTTTITNLTHTYKIADSGNSSNYIKFFKDNTGGAIPNSIEIEDTNVGVSLYLTPPPPQKYWSGVLDMNSGGDGDATYRIQHLKVSGTGNQVNSVSVSNASNNFVHNETFGCSSAYTQCQSGTPSINATYTLGHYHYNSITFRAGNDYGAIYYVDPSGTPTTWGYTANGSGGGSASISTDTVTVSGDSCSLAAGPLYEYLSISSGVAKERFSPGAGDPSYLGNPINFQWGVFSAHNADFATWSGQAEISERVTAP